MKILSDVYIGEELLILYIDGYVRRESSPHLKYMKYEPIEIQEALVSAGIYKLQDSHNECLVMNPSTDRQTWMKVNELKDSYLIDLINIKLDRLRDEPQKPVATSTNSKLPF